MMKHIAQHNQLPDYRVTIDEDVDQVVFTTGNPGGIIPNQVPASGD